MKFRLFNYQTMCPTQWGGSDEDGNFIFVRYRGGRLTVWQSPDEFQKGECIITHYQGDAFDGYLSDDDLRSFLQTQDIEVEFLQGETIDIDEDENDTP